MSDENWRAAVDKHEARQAVRAELVAGDDIIIDAMTDVVAQQEQRHRVGVA